MEGKIVELGGQVPPEDGLPLQEPAPVDMSIIQSEDQPEHIEEIKQDFDLEDQAPYFDTTIDLHDEDEPEGEESKDPALDESKADLAKEILDLIPQQDTAINEEL